MLGSFILYFPNTLFEKSLVVTFNKTFLGEFIVKDGYF